MFEERLRDILRNVYCGRNLVFSTMTARETLFAKGLSPAIFLHKYYVHNLGEAKVSYNFKQRTVKDMCDVCPIDAEEYDCYRESHMNQLIKKKMVGNSKLPRQLTKEDLTVKHLIEHYLKSLNFFWFQEAAQLFLYCLSLDENNFRMSTLEQPIGLTFIIEVTPKLNLKAEYEKVRKEADNKLKKIFALNPTRTKNLPVLVLLLFNAEKGGTMAEMRAMHDSLRQEYSLQSGLLGLVEINGSDAKDSVDWSSYPRVVIKNEYKLHPSDPVRLFGQNEDNQVIKFVSTHRQKIRGSMQDRLRWLGARYEETNTTKNKFFNFFKSQQSDKSYTSDEIESRQIADTLFLLGDYKRSLDLFKDLSEKFEGSRDAAISYNVSEMVQLGKFMCSITGGNKVKAYESIQKYAEKAMLKKAQALGKNRIYRYLILLMYFLHGFRTFNRDFIKNSYYYYIKRVVNEEAVSEHNPHPSLIPTLVHQQYANLNLLYPFPQYRRYAYDIIRVASKFSQFRLYDHHLRCLLIANSVYKGTFPTIEKYINSTLSRTYLELKKYRFSLERIQQTWKTLLSLYQDQPVPSDEDNEFTKLYSSQGRLLNEIQRAEPEELTRPTDDCIPVPRISDVLVQVRDEALQLEGLGSKWQDVGDAFLSQTELTSKGMNKQNLIKMLKLFDSASPEEKELAYRLKNLPQGTLSQPILKRNTRQAFVGEPILVSFDMKNYLPLTIQVSNIRLHLKVQKKCIITMHGSSDKLILKQGQKASVNFELVPQQVGLFELSHISWTFFKMTSIYRFKEPWETTSPLKSLYFKLNVLEECGQLEVSVKNGHTFYEGQTDEIQLQLDNVGKEPIEELYLAVDNKEIFGFRMVRLDIKIKPGESQINLLKVKMPLLKGTNFLKYVSKGILLYRTGSYFRVQRVVMTFKVHRVAELMNLSCERISTTLHFLSFSIRHPQNQPDLLKSMVLHRGMDIKKIETNHLGILSHYFFFMRKNPETELEEHKFTIHDLPAKNIIKQSYLFPKEQEQDEGQRDNTLQMFLLWGDKEGHGGVIDPKPIAITANENSSSLLKLPFNAKVLLVDEVEFDFQESVMGEVEVQFIVKNIFSVKDINMTVDFMEGAANDFYWQGLTEHHLCLSFNEQKKMKLKLLLVRPGLFNVARNIKYTILINKTNSYTRYHSDYENIYLTANLKQVQKQSSPSPSFDFFQQYPASAFKKQPQQEESLI